MLFRRLSVDQSDTYPENYETMEDWQGGKSSQKKKGRRKGGKVSKTPKRARSIEPGENDWLRDKGKRSSSWAGGHSNPERWNWIPEQVVDWVKVGYYTKLWSLIAMAIILSVLFVLWLIWHKKTTAVVVLEPEVSSRHWLGSTEFLSPSIFDRLAPNPKLNVQERVDFVDLAIEGKTLPTIEVSGPDRNLLVVYLRATSITFAPNNNSAESRPEYTTFVLNQNAKPFDYQEFTNDRSGLVPLEDILDSVAARTGKNEPHKLVVLDLQPVESPTNPSTFVDRLPQSVEQLFRRKKNAEYSDLTLVIPHRLGEKSWTMPEEENSVLGHFTRLALLGAADGAINNKPDRYVSFEEFEKYLSNRTNGYVARNWNSTQRPVFISNNLPTDLRITVCPYPDELRDDLEAKKTETVNYLTVCRDFELDKKWSDYRKAKPDLLAAPYLDARAVAILSRMEWLCARGSNPARFRSPNQTRGELGSLDDEWDSIFDNLPSRPIFGDALSIQEHLQLQQPHSFSPTQEEEVDELFKLGAFLYDAPPLPGSEPAVSQPSASSEQSDSGATGNENQSANAGQPPPNSKEIKQKSEEFDQRVHQYATGSQSLILIWKLWEECRQTNWRNQSRGLREFLTFWLDQVRNPEAKELLEAKYLQLLVDNVDWGNSGQTEATENCVELAIQCRHSAEQILAMTCQDSRVLLWISEDLKKLTNQIRIGEDHLFANDYEVAKRLLAGAKERLESRDEGSIRWQAETIRQAIQHRDELLRDLPHIAVLIARQKLRNPIEVQSDIKRQYLDTLQEWEAKHWQQMYQQAHQLSVQLSNVVRPELPAIRQYLDGENAQRLLNLDKEIKQHCRDLLDQEDLDTVRIFAPDLIGSPLVESETKEQLRKKYQESLELLKEDRKWLVEIGARISEDQDQGSVDQSARDEQLRISILDFQTFLEAAQRSAKPEGDYRKLLTESWINSYAKYPNLSRFSKSKLASLWDEISKQENRDRDQREPSLDQSLKEFLGRLAGREHWLRAGAAVLAENGVYDPNKNNEPDDPYVRFQNNMEEFHFVRRLNYQLARAETNFQDFWGDNGRETMKGPYYERIADRVEQRLPDIVPGQVTETSEYLRDRLESQIAEQLASLKNSFGPRKFEIKSDRFEYIDFVDKELPPHEIRLWAGTEWRKELDHSMPANLVADPVVAVQIQQDPKNELRTPLEIGLIGSSAGTKPVRRFKATVGEVIDQEFKFLNRELSQDLTSVQAFRGHLVQSRFEIQRNPPPVIFDWKPEYIPLKPYQPQQVIPPTITVRGGKGAKVDIMFVFDCSGSMRDSDVQKFRNVLEGILRGADAEMFNVGLVAIGSQVYFKKRGEELINELSYSSPQIEARLKQNQASALLPHQDAYVVQELGPLKGRIDELVGKLELLRSHGSTPLYFGMEMAADRLKKGTAKQKLVIAVTDGVEWVVKFDRNNQWIKDDPESDNIFRSLEAMKDDIQFHCIKYENNSNRPADFAHRIQQLKQLCGPNFLAAQNIDAMKERLQAITSKPKFAVYRTDPERTIENGQPWRWVERFEPGVWKICPFHAWQSFDPQEKEVFLYGGENLEFRLENWNLPVRLVKDRQWAMNFEKVEDKQVRGPSGDFFDVFLTNLRIEKTENIPLRFVFDDPRSDSTILRPERICLEAIREPDDEVAVSYLLQDVEFDDYSGFPSAIFHAPKIAPGIWNFRLWYQPKDVTNRNRIKLRPNKKLPPEDDLFGLEPSLQLKVSSDERNQSVTVRLSLPTEDWTGLQDQQIRQRLSSLRNLIVDVQVIKNGKFFRDFAVTRRFSKELLETPVEFDPRMLGGNPLLAEHTFELEDDFEKDDVYLMIRRIEDAFDKNDISFPKQVAQ
jgi:hypothetical protein